MKDQKSLQLSLFIVAMDKAFSDAKMQGVPWPVWRLRLEHAPILKGMAASYSHWLYDNPYQLLLDGLQNADFGIDVTVPPNAGFAMWAVNYAMRKWPNGD